MKSPLCSHFTEQDDTVIPEVAAQRAVPCRREPVLVVSQETWVRILNCPQIKAYSLLRSHISRILSDIAELTATASQPGLWLRCCLGWRCVCTAS